MPLDGEYEPSAWDWVREPGRAVRELRWHRGARRCSTPGCRCVDRHQPRREVRQAPQDPLMRSSTTDKYAAVASVGGEPTHPAWDSNLTADPHVEVQDGPDQVRTWSPARSLVRRRRSGGRARSRRTRRTPSTRPQPTREIPVFVLGCPLPPHDLHERSRGTPPLRSFSVARRRTPSSTCSGRLLAAASSGPPRCPVGDPCAKHRAERRPCRPRARPSTARSSSATLNRGTLHLVRSDDYWWLQPPTTPQLATANAPRLHQEQVSPDEAGRGVAVIERALADDGPLTRNELRTRLAAAGVRVEGQALVHILLARDPGRPGRARTCARRRSGLCPGPRLARRLRHCHVTSPSASWPVATSLATDRRATRIWPSWPASPWAMPAAVMLRSATSWSNERTASPRSWTGHRTPSFRHPAARRLRPVPARLGVPPPDHRVTPEAS